eukprot:COSAG02_NODE_63850_length_262_cov_0.631902_1_plen_68_part_00
MHRLTAFYATNELVAAAVTNSDADGTDAGLTAEVCGFNMQLLSRQETAHVVAVFRVDLLSRCISISH